MKFHKEYGEGSEENKDPLTHKVIGCAIEVHRLLGPGLLESAYHECLARELSLAEMQFRSQVSMPIQYKGCKLDCGYRLDFLIEDSLILELKSVEYILGIHEAQIITYMKLAGVSSGLILNFNVTVLRAGIRRLFPSLFSPSSL